MLLFENIQGTIKKHLWEYRRDGSTSDWVKCFQGGFLGEVIQIESLKISRNQSENRGLGKGLGA